MKNILYAFALLFLASCSSKSYPDQSWDGKQWTLVEMIGVPVQTSGGMTNANIIFDSSQQMISGNGGCNRIFAPYEFGKKKSISFGDIGSTRMACQNAPFENKFLEILKSVMYYENTGVELVLKNGSKDVILKFQ
jgi:heat shock protein HslJ